MAPRLSRLQYFMRVALTVAQRSTCNRAKVGAVLVDPYDNVIVATGYNGSMPLSPHCIDKSCLMHGDHCIRTIHAEANAILHLGKRYPQLHLYCTHQPCCHCIKLLVTIGVVKIFYIHPYKDYYRDRLLNERPYKISMEKVNDRDLFPERNKK